MPPKRSKVYTPVTLLKSKYIKCVMGIDEVLSWYQYYMKITCIGTGMVVFYIPRPRHGMNWPKSHLLHQILCPTKTAVTVSLTN